MRKPGLRPKDLVRIAARRPSVSTARPPNPMRPDAEVEPQLPLSEMACDDRLVARFIDAANSYQMSP